MVGESASLLTKTQRNRIRDDFDELTEEKQRRDQQRIRERLRSGLADFQLLADYPDRQFALTFDSTPEDELRAALADTTIVVERLRELHGIDRAELVDEIRVHTEEFSETSVDAGSLGQINLRTADEIRHRTETEVEERLGTGRWDKRANRLAKIGASAFVPLVSIGILDQYIDGNLLQEYAIVVGPLMFVLTVCLTGWLLIVAAQAVKYDIIPFFVTLARNPEQAMRDAVSKLVKNPGETVRESWNDL